MFVTFNKHFADGGSSLLKASNSFRQVFNNYSPITPEIKNIEKNIEVLPIDFKMKILLWNKKVIKKSFHK